MLKSFICSAGDSTLTDTLVFPPGSPPFCWAGGRSPPLRLLARAVGPPPPSPPPALLSLPLLLPVSAPPERPVRAGLPSPPPPPPPPPLPPFPARRALAAWGGETSAPPPARLTGTTPATADGAPADPRPGVGGAAGGAEGGSRDPPPRGRALPAQGRRLASCGTEARRGCPGAGGAAGGAGL